LSKLRLVATKRLAQQAPRPIANYSAPKFPGGDYAQTGVAEGVLGQPIGDEAALRYARTLAFRLCKIMAARQAFRLWQFAGTAGWHARHLLSPCAREQMMVPK
jgi:hypothetical protein